MDTIMSDPPSTPSTVNNGGARFQFGRRPSEGELTHLLTTFHTKIDLLDAKVDEANENIADKLDALATQMDRCAEKSDLDEVKVELSEKMDRRETMLLEVDVSFREVRAISRAWRKPRAAMYEAVTWAWCKARDLLRLASQGIAPYLSPGVIAIALSLILLILAACLGFGPGSVDKTPNEGKAERQEPAWSKIRSEVHVQELQLDFGGRF